MKWFHASTRKDRRLDGDVAFAEDTHFRFVILCDGSDSLPSASNLRPPRLLDWVLRAAGQICGNIRSAHELCVQIIHFKFQLVQIACADSNARSFMPR
jgi:hypothetical protein